MEKIYANLIRKGLKELDDVPEKNNMRNKVKAILEAEE